MRHMSINIEWAIENAKHLLGCITIDGTVLQTVAEVRKFLKGQLALGRKVLPIGDCDNFDYQTGCKGHKINKTEVEE